MDGMLPNAVTVVNSPSPTADSDTHMENRLEINEATVQTKHATKNLQRVFRVTGLSMPKTYRSAYVTYALVMQSISVFFPISFGISFWRVTHAGMERDAVGPLLTGLQAFLSVISCESKLYTLAMTRAKWRSAEAIMAHLDRRCRQSAEEVDVLRLCVRHCNRVVEFFLVCYFTYIGSTFLGAFLTNRPMYNLYLPGLDWRLSRTQFVISSIIEFGIESVACFQQVFDDAFSLIHIWILRTHMKILLMRFSKLGNASMSLQENFDELKQCIRDHKNYLELYNIIAPIISLTIFIQFVLTAFILSVTFINLMMISTDYYSRVGSVFYVVAVLAEILPVCYLAQCLMDDSNRLTEIIFHSNWIEQDARYRKMLVFLMQRTQCTKDLTAGKLFPINLSFCLSILKFSFSLYTLIKTMGLQEKFGN